MIGAVNGWNRVGFELSTRFQTKTSAYVVTKQKHNFDEINKLTAEFSSVSATSGNANGTLIMGLVSAPSSEEFVASCTKAVGFNTGYTVMELDLSNIKGEYYIKILLKGNGKSMYVQDYTWIYGE